MKHFIAFITCSATLYFMFIGMEAMLGQYWVIGIVPGAFIGYTIFREIDKIFE